ncbi:MAG: hypothetical protein JWO44_1735 [Bacteroidetes bacterium]|nr:hypothetical protein [Bacteroidota bacterium]
MLNAPNPYDIDLVRLYYLAKYQVDFLNIPATEKIKYKNTLLRNVKQFCRLSSSNFKQHLFGPVPLVIRSGDHLYHQFLPFALLHMDLDKIRFFLNHQLRMHKGNYLIPRDGFAAYIERDVCRQIEKLSLIDTKERLQEIREWLEFNRTKQPKEKKLVWTDPTKYDLDKLSEKLYCLGFMEGPEDFKNIFTRNKKTKWLKSIEELAYLFYYLKHRGIIRPEATRGYLRHLEYIFDHLAILQNDGYGLNGVLIRMKGRRHFMKMEIEELVNNALFTPHQKAG